jgi:hypothetical protein
MHGRFDLLEDLKKRGVAVALSEGDRCYDVFPHLIDAILLAHQKNLGTAREWLLQIAPLVDAFPEYADRGDHTLPGELARALVEVAPDLYPAYYANLDPNYRDSEALDGFYYRFIEPYHLDLKAAQTPILTFLPEKKDGFPILPKRPSDAPGDFLDPSAFPPGRLIELVRYVEKARWDVNTWHIRPGGPAQPMVEELSALPANVGEQISRWLPYWESKGCLAEALQDIERLSLDDLFWHTPTIWPVVHSLLGAGEVYDWVLRAQRSLGWSRMLDEEDSATSTWAFVRRNFPERWLLFLQETLSDKFAETSRFSPDVVASYLVFMGSFFIQCTNALKIDTPKWIGMP